MPQGHSSIIGIHLNQESPKLFEIQRLHGTNNNLRVLSLHITLCLFRPRAYSSSVFASEFSSINFVRFVHGVQAQCHRGGESTMEQLLSPLSCCLLFSSRFVTHDKQSRNCWCRTHPRMCLFIFWAAGRHSCRRLGNEGVRDGCGVGCHEVCAASGRNLPAIFHLFLPSLLRDLQARGGRFVAFGGDSGSRRIHDALFLLRFSRRS